MADVIPILMYHHVAGRAPAGFAKYTVRPGALRRQLGWLAGRGYRTVDLDDLVAARRSEAPLPERPLILTFDDGFGGAIDAALPLLAEHGMRATFFIVAGRIGGPSDWLERERGVVLPLAGRDAVRRVADLGFVVGSHTMSHPHLPALSASSLEAELVESRHVLEDVVGQAVRHLAYPHGENDAAVRQAAADAGYVTAVSTEAGFAGPATDFLALPRLIVDGRDTIAGLAARLRTAESARELVTQGPMRALRRLRAGPPAAVR